VQEGFILFDIEAAGNCWLSTSVAE